MDIRENLKKIDLFSQLSDLEIDEIASGGKVKSYKKGSIVFTQGQEAIGAFFVLEGRVKIYKLGADGKQHILHIFGAGEIFAEAAMFAGGTYPAYAEALQDSKLFYWAKANLLYLIEKKPSLAIKMLASQAMRLRSFSAKIEDLSLKEVSARLAGYMVDQAGSGRKTDKGLELKLPMNKSQLASYLGTIGETLSRTLTSFKNKGLIDEDNNSIVIKNLEKLKEISQS